MPIDTSTLRSHEARRAQAWLRHHPIPAKLARFSREEIKAMKLRLRPPHKRGGKARWDERLTIEQAQLCFNLSRAAIVYLGEMPMAAILAWETWGEHRARVANDRLARLGFLTPPPPDLPALPAARLARSAQGAREKSEPLAKTLDSLFELW